MIWWRYINAITPPYFDCTHPSHLLYICESLRSTIIYRKSLQACGYGRLWLVWWKNEAASFFIKDARANQINKNNQRSCIFFNSLLRPARHWSFTVLVWTPSIQTWRKQACSKCSMPLAIYGEDGEAWKAVYLFLVRVRMFWTELQCTRRASVPD